MGMTSEQAKAMALRPRITAEEEDQMVSLRAEGKKPPEIALLFPAYAQGTIANLLSRKKDRVNELRRMRTVQYEHIPRVRKQARLAVLDEAADKAMEQFRLLLESASVIDGVTGEVRQGLVDPRLFKPFTGLAAQLNFFFCYILSPVGLADDLVAGWFG